MGTLIVPSEWIVNHMRLASRLATVIEGMYLRSEASASSAILFAAGLPDSEWQKAAHIAGKTDGYSPSLETRLMVLESRSATRRRTTRWRSRRCSPRARRSGRERGHEQGRQERPSSGKP